MKNEVETASFATDLTGAERVGSDEFFYDIFGVNIKGLKSIWTLLKRPADYFDAARIPDWGGEHWPSIRIWLGIMGILVALQFLWASENSEMTAMFQNLATIPAQSISDHFPKDGQSIDISGLDKAALGKKAFKLWVFIYPFFFIAAMCLLAFIFRAWKPAGSFVIRLRYIFGIIIPASVFGLLSTLAMVNVTGDVYMIISFIMLPVMVILYAITAYRGPFHTYERGERIGMSIVIALLIFTFLIIAQTISMILACAPIWMEVVEILKPQIDAATAARDAAEQTTP